ncbi:MAG: hypothetical protein HQK51_12375 [Oligoflexia bacterium]|nr:hypothetical protein [Oligoflexia bacterium]
MSSNMNFNYFFNKVTNLVCVSLSVFILMSYSAEIRSDCIESYNKKIDKTFFLFSGKYKKVLSLIEKSTKSLTSNTYISFRKDLEESGVRLVYGVYIYPAVLGKVIADLNKKNLLCKYKDSPTSYSELLEKFKELANEAKKIEQEQCLEKPILIPKEIYEFSNDVLAIGKPLLQEEKESITDYMIGSMKINGDLRKGVTTNITLKKIMGLISGLKKLPVSKISNPVYRGSDYLLGGKTASELAIGDVVTDNAFVSTSKTTQGASKVLKYNIIILENKNGRSLNSLVDQSLISKMQAVEIEEEVLFPPGCKFKYLGTTEFMGERWYQFKEVI